MSVQESLTITFRCPPELISILPQPVPAVQGLPEWFKSMPRRAFSGVLQQEQPTVKRCPPFVDAMTYGFLIPLATDVKVQNGLFTWNYDIPHFVSGNPGRSPLDFHDNNQVKGSPFFEEDQVLVKFNCFWTIELPPGFSLFVTHPVNRIDLPFVSLTGLVDSDLYRDNFINFPARWLDPEFSGVLSKGTPVAQCIPVRRDEWVARFESLGEEELKRINVVKSMLANETEVYRHHFRARKR